MLLLNAQRGKKAQQRYICFDLKEWSMQERAPPAPLKSHDSCGIRPANINVGSQMYQTKGEIKEVRNSLYQGLPV